jgi:hypothetical protein
MNATSNFKRNTTATNHQSKTCSLNVLFPLVSFTLLVGAQQLEWQLTLPEKLLAAAIRGRCANLLVFALDTQSHNEQLPYKHSSLLA